MEITTSTVFLRHARGSLRVRAPAPSTATKQSCCLRAPGVGRNWNKRLLSTARAAVARPQEVVVVAPPPPAREEEVAAPPPPPPPAARETTAAAAAATAVYYHDSWLDKLAIEYLSRNLQEASGLKKKKNGKDGYEGLIEAALTVSAIFGVDEQWETVASALERAVPSYILATVKALMPPSSRFSREYFAAFTTVFFPWLVGPCEVRESEVDGRKERNVVYIPKCRFLESTKCVGMCTNLCKIPCQKFIQDSFGMPVYMSPNFEDMSCEMIFGQEPPQDDPALKQPCFATKCIAKRNHEVNCSA